MRLLVTVTLNPNQLRAHVEPITDLDEVEAVTLVTDVAPPPMAKLRAVVPPPWLVRLCGRAAAKLLTGLIVAARERPHWIIGYNLMPHAINALVIARLTRRRALMHLIGGPVEWEGGGHRSDNAVLSRLPRPVPALERLLVRAIAAADAVAVMGTGARDDLIARGVRADRVQPLPASVDSQRFRPGGAHATYDVVTASQLIPRKRLDDFLEAIALLRRERPDVRAAIAGTGPLRDELVAEARRLGVEDAVDFLGFVGDIERVYRDSRVFVLTSEYEGLSIAMTEAMASGVPVVVTDVGEARDVVAPGVNGQLFRLGDVPSLAEHLRRILGDDAEWQRMSEAAVQAVQRSSSRERVAQLSRALLTRRR